MKLPIQVTYKDGRSESIVSEFADFIDFERTWSRSIRRFEEELRLTDIAWLAWSQLSRRQMTKAKFSPDWIETVEMVEITEEEKPEQEIAPFSGASIEATTTP
jgi:hypothetical protein